MEPNKNKLEQEFKQKLDQRTIQPTGMAWDRLDAMLSVTEQASKKKKPNRTWMYMAACFLALLLAGSFFLNQQKNSNEINTNGNSVVTNDASPTTAPEQINGTPATINQPAPQQDAVATVTKPVRQIKTHQQPAQTATEIIVNQTVQQEQQQVAQNNILPEVITPDIKYKKITVDANGLLASVEGKGQTAVASTKINEPQIKVSPSTLLSSVEGELNDSFRGKVLNTISKNYTTVKTAVANRNLQ